MSGTTTCLPFIYIYIYIYIYIQIVQRQKIKMTVTRVSRTKRSSDYAVGTLEFEFKEDSRNGRVSDWLHKICFRDGI